MERWSTIDEILNTGCGGAFPHVRRIGLKHGRVISAGQAGQVLSKRGATCYNEAVLLKGLEFWLRKYSVCGD
ncbi:MAG: hypothetical protein ABL967_18265 [Bryobacteraceae bacterium]